MADSPDASDQQRDLLSCLDEIAVAGIFAACDHYPVFVNPGLRIRKGRIIPLPLSLTDAEVIKSACREVPFGMGEPTIVEQAVVHASGPQHLELDSSQFELANPEWGPFLANVVLKAADSLGLTGVVAHSHRLLLYGRALLPTCTKTRKMKPVRWAHSLSVFPRGTREERSTSRPTRRSERMPPGRRPTGI